MKALLLCLAMVALALPVSAQVQISTTPYSRGFLLKSTAAAARTYLGVSASGTTNFPTPAYFDSIVVSNGIVSLLAGASAFDAITVTNAAVFNGSLQVPTGAAPTTDAFGEIAADNNAWAASRGALQFWDGTANTYLIGVVVSDVPSNGQVPTWNTGGFLTFETPGGGSSAPTNTVVSLSTPSIANSLAGFPDANGTNISALNLSFNGTSFQIGTNAAAPSAKVIIASGPRGGTDSNTVGVSTTIAGSPGTGTGAGGSLILATSPAGGAGSNTNASVPALTIISTGAATFAGALASGAFTGTSTITAGTTVTAGGASSFLWTGRSRMLSPLDGQIFMQNTGNTGFGVLQFGPDDTTPDTYVSLQAASGVGADKTSGGIIIQTGATTGMGKPGSIELKTAIKGTASNSSTNAVKVRYHIEGSPAALTDNTATLVFNLALASGKFAGGRLLSTTYATDGTDHQIDTSTWMFSAANKAGTVTTTIKPVALDLGTTEAILATTGTLTNGWTAVANGNGIDFKCTAKSSLTTTIYTSNWELELNTNDTGTIVSQ